MLLYDINKPLLDFDDKPIEEVSVDDDGKPLGKKEMTLGDVMIGVLMNISEKDQGITGEKKLSRFMLSSRVKEAAKGDGMVKLETDDVHLIKKLVGEKSAPIVVGRVWGFLEDEGEKPPSITMLEKGSDGKPILPTKPSNLGTPY